MRRLVAGWIAWAAIGAGGAWAQLTVNCTPTTLPQLVGTSVSVTCAASGGTGPYTWSISAGALPPGLSQNVNSGAITGTLQDPAGAYAFTVTATDTVAPNATGSQAYSGTTVDKLTVVCTPPPPAGPVEAGVPYSATCTASGGTQPYGWSLVGTAVPPGMAVTPTGAATAAIAYTPPGAMAAYQYRVQLTDSSDPPLPPTGTAAYTGAIAAAVTITTPSPLPAAAAGSPYALTFTAANGVIPYAWSSTDLPLWLSLNPSTGALTGTPPAAGSVSFHVTVTDGAGGTSVVPFTLPVNGALTISPPSPLPAATVNAAYSQTFSATGGAGGYTWSATGMPAWLTLNASTGALTGTPKPPVVSASFTVTVTDSSKNSASAPYVLPVTLAITTLPALPAATIGTAYNQTLTAAGGSGGYTWALTSGTLPAGLLLNSSGVVSGTPQPAAVDATFQATVTDSSNASTSVTFTLPVALVISTKTPLPGGAIGVPYSQTLAGAGGTPPYTWSITAGFLPNNLALNASTGAITGSPTTAGTFNFTVQLAGNASDTPVAKQFSITIAGSLTITTAPLLPVATVGTGYSQTLSAVGGMSPYTWSIIQGALPAPLTLNPTTGVIAGTPATTGTFNFTAQVTDHSTPAATATKAFTLTVAPALSITTASLPNGTVGVSYSQTLAATGGTPPYSWLITAGAQPPGTNLNPTTGVLSGIPTASGSFGFTVGVTDTNSVTATRQFTVVIAGALIITTAPELPSGSVGSPYTETLAASGGTPPYRWALLAGTLPSGLALSTAGVISGTPAGPATNTFTVQVTDNAGVMASKALTLNIVSGLTVSTASPLPSGEIGVAYTQNLTASGGALPYTWSVTAGALPGGLSLSTAGVISGTPSAAGTFNFTVQVASNSTTASKALTLVIAPPLSISTAATLPVGSVNTSYAQNLQAAAGVPPYTWKITAGSLPAGLSLSSAGAITGTPSASGKFTFTAQVSDAAGATASLQFSITIVQGPVITTSPTLPAGSTNTPYSQTLAAIGGIPPYTWTLTAGALPAGLSLSPAGTISGTPTSAGTFNFTVQVTDSASATGSLPFTLTISAGLGITTTSLPNGHLGTPYNQTITASGGTGPYTFSVISGTLPAGITLASSGALSGTTNQAGAFTFTVQVTDSTTATATRQLTLTIAGLTITTAAPLPTAALGVPYSVTLAADGTAPYTWSLAHGALPGGLTLASATGIISGTPTAAGSFPVTIQVADATSATAQAAFTLTVISGAFTGVPATASPAQQLTVGLALDAAYASAITGSVTLAFQPDAALGAPADDPSIQFSTGGRTVTFTIAAQTKTAVFQGGTLDLQTGTVAGTITLSVTWQSGGASLPAPAALTQTIQIARSAPVITQVTASTTSSGFQVQVTGYSTTREVTQAMLQFTAASGQTLQTTSLTVPLTDAANTWFQGSASDQYGSQFILTLPFTVTNGGASAIASVSVQLVNTAGTSNSMSGSL